MSSHQRTWVFSLCLLAVALLFMRGSVAATSAAQPPQSDLTAPVYAGQPQAPKTLADVGMSDLVSETFEFAGAFSTGWQTYDNITRSPGSVYTLTYSWSTTEYTRAQGTRSAVAVAPKAGSVFLPGIVYTDPVDSWLVFPVDLSSVWQAQMDFAYLKPSASGYLTVVVSTNYDPVSHTGTFTGEALPQAAGWMTHTLPLSSYAGQKVYVAFRYQSLNGGQQSNGPFVDDLHVRANYRVMLPLVSKWMLTLAKSVSADIILPGQSLVYSLTVNNADPYNAATGVTLHDTLPVSTTFVSADGPYSYSNGVVTWLGLTVPSGGSIVQHLIVTVPSDVPWGSAIVNKDYAISVPPDTSALYGLPVTTTVAGAFFDDFSDSTSGWLQGEYTPPGNMCTPPGKWRAGYQAGRYGVNTVCAWNGMLYPAPVRLADPANFTLEVDLASNQSDLWYSSYGVFFNASEDLRQTYIVRLFQGQQVPEWAAYYWPNFQGSSDDQPPPQMLTYATCWTCTGQDFGWNHIVVQRRGAIFEVWMGTPGHLARMAIFNDARLVDSQHTRVGVHHANFEWRGDASSSWYAYLFDNFRLTLARR